MSLHIPCARCGTVFTIDEQLAGRKIRCQTCGQIQRIPIAPVTSVAKESRSALSVYALAPEPLTSPPEKASERQVSTRKPRRTNTKQSVEMNWHRLFRAGTGESSLLEAESLGLIALSVADLLVTYALLQRSPAFYEANPVAQWFFVRWNIAGMALFKFSAMGLVVVIGEIVEHHRPGWGRGLLTVSCLATAAVVFQGLRLLFGHQDNGAPLQ
jgi:predicted Zn finger-like uncharacterized protein